MKILYDYQIFRKQRYGGISRYYTNLIRFFDEHEAIVPCYHSRNYYYNKLKGNYDHKYESMIFEYLHDNISRIMTKRVLRKMKVDIFHPTSTETYFLKYLKNEKLVVTVHDLAKELYPSFTSRQKEYMQNRRKLLEAADHIIAVSNNTREDLMRIYNIQSDKITVVYHGLPSRFGRIRINLRGLPERFILYVGNREQNKNFDLFLEAVSEILLKDNELSLLCVGGGEFTEEEKAKIRGYHIQKKIRQRNINDEVLAACYKQAKMFVFPSYYEGFGIPILEAFRMSCPIVLSDIGSFREVAKEAGIYMNPLSVDDIREKIEWTLSEDNQKEVMRRVELGNQMVKTFTLSNTYQNTMKVYEKLLSEKDY